MGAVIPGMSSLIYPSVFVERPYSKDFQSIQITQPKCECNL